MAWTSPSSRSSSWAICRFDHVEAHEIQAQHPNPQELVMTDQHRAGEIVEARLAVPAQPALARVPGIVPAVPDHVVAVAGRAPHAIRPAMWRIRSKHLASS